MTDERSCPHDTTEAVYAYVHPPIPKVGDTVEVLNEGRPVARICTACLIQLPAAWGCTDCEWVEERRLCDPAPTLHLARPCQEHA